MMLLHDHLNGSEYYHPTKPDVDLDDPTQPLRNLKRRRELTARRIAQWAINVVDFRDSNAIMTPFEYDVDPFNGWQQMDGDPTTPDIPDPPAPGFQNERRVVWGAEYPDLLITESAAFHDVRMKDTKWDTSGKKTDDPNNPDPFVDQYRIPQGSLFLEFYCTRNRVAPRNYKVSHELYPRELYNVVTDPRRACYGCGPGSRPHDSAECR